MWFPDTFGSRETEMARERPDNSYVPTDYEDLYRYYIRTPGTVSLAEATIKRAIPTADYEQLQELAHEAFLRMKRFTILERFDADKSNFGGMVFVAARSAAVNWLSRNEHDPNGALRGGSLVETQRTNEKGEGFEPGTYSLDRIFGSDETTHEDRISAIQAVKKTLEWAKGLAGYSKILLDQMKTFMAEQA
jgi:hypothetical protein